MEVRIVKEGAILAPYDSDSEDWLRGKSDNQYFVADIKTPRNYKFHKKFFALLNVAFQHWEPGELENKFGVVEKSFEQFREDVTILAGYYEQSFRLDGSVKTRAKSISFAAMDDEEFSKFYSSVLDVLIKKVLVGWSIEQVDAEIGTFL